MMIETVFALAVILGWQEVPPGATTSGRGGYDVVGSSAAQDAPASFSAGKFLTDGKAVVPGARGPTVHLSYGRDGFRGNPVCSFMYFIPLISPVAVSTDTSGPDGQEAGIISYTRHVTSKAFQVKCEFEMKGTGCCRYVFDPGEMIALRRTEARPGETLAHMLDYIRFEGAGFGRLQVRGTMNGTVATVTEVNVEFSARGRESPVTIGLYEIKPRNGQYDYAHRTGEIVARVNTLTFRRSENPRMGISVASISKKTQRAGLYGCLKASVANLLIKPIRVDKLGNEAMLDFGYALLRQDNVFTFPEAGNLKAAIVAAACPRRE